MALMLLGLPMTATVQEPESSGLNSADPIGAYLQSQVGARTLAGAVVLVADKDRTLYLKPSGYSDLAARTPMPADAMFWIASTSKPMTATALMMLVDEGKVSLDDPVERYLPEFKGQKVRPRQHISNPDAQISSGVPVVAPLAKASHPIRVREILSHTSGLPFRSLVQPGALDLLPLKDQVRSFAAEPLLSQPGTEYSYSNEGLDTAARIIEVVSGMPYERFMQQRLFDPLGMKDTTFWPDKEQIARLAKSYKYEPKAKQLVAIQIDQLTYPLDDRRRRYPVPAGGLFSTAMDVAKFCRMILSGGEADGRRYISAAALAEMTKRQNGKLSDSGYGLGWGVNGSVIEHGGAYKNDMEIDRATGRIFLFMVQQAGDWGTAQGDAMVTTVKRLANKIPAAP